MIDLNSPEVKWLESLTEAEMLAMTMEERIALMWPLAVLDYAKRGIDVSNQKFDRTAIRVCRRMPDGTAVEVWRSDSERTFPSSDPINSADPTD